MRIRILFFVFLFFDIVSTTAYGLWWWIGSDSGIGVVDKVKGNVFAAQKNTMRRIRKGDKIYKYSEIITEEGAQISFSDHNDHKFHLAGSGHVRCFDKIMKLKRGYLWVQSYKKKR